MASLTGAGGAGALAAGARGAGRVAPQLCAFVAQLTPRGMSAALLPGRGGSGRLVGRTDCVDGCSLVGGRISSRASIRWRPRGWRSGRLVGWRADERARANASASAGRRRSWLFPFLSAGAAVIDGGSMREGERPDAFCLIHEWERDGGIAGGWCRGESAGYVGQGSFVPSLPAAFAFMLGPARSLSMGGSHDR